MILETDIDTRKWSYFIKYIINASDEVSFNILYKGKEYDSMIKEYEEDLVYKIIEREVKIYPSGNSVNFRMSDRIKQLLISLNYEEWNNKFITDPSFFNNGYEIVASVIHEDYLIFKNDFKDYKQFINNGFLMNKHIEDFGYESFSIFKWVKEFFK